MMQWFLSRFKGLVVSGFSYVKVSKSEKQQYFYCKRAKTNNKGLLNEREVCTVKYQTEVF